jgi:hypothetical protein
MVGLIKWPVSIILRGKRVLWMFIAVGTVVGTGSDPINNKLLNVKTTKESSKTNHN